MRLVKGSTLISVPEDSMPFLQNSKKQKQIALDSISTVDWHQIVTFQTGKLEES